MTMQDFMKKNNVKGATMDRWLKNNWIRGAKLLPSGDYSIPEGAIKPFTRRSIRCRDTTGMYKSIVNGCAQGRDVFAELYDIHPSRFDFFVERLEKAEFLEKRTIDGVTYLMPLEKCIEYKDRSTAAIAKHISVFLEAMSPAIEAFGKGLGSTLSLR